MRKFTIGQSARRAKVVTAEEIAFFAEYSGDNNPVHIDPEFAAKTRFKGVIAHGMIATVLMTAILGTELPGPGSVYLSQSIKFTAPVRPGDEITAEVTVKAWNAEKRIITVETRCFNQHSADVLTGEAVLLVDDLPA
jgi:acyl dehydratase